MLHTCWQTIVLTCKIHPWYCLFWHSEICKVVFFYLYLWYSYLWQCTDLAKFSTSLNLERFLSFLLWYYPIFVSLFLFFWQLSLFSSFGFSFFAYFLRVGTDFFLCSFHILSPDLQTNVILTEYFTVISNSFFLWLNLFHSFQIYSFSCSLSQG